MKKLTLYIFFSLLWCNVGFADWKNFTPDDKGGVYTYFDTKSIKKSESFVQVWTLTDYPYRDSEGNHSNKVLLNFNCNNFEAEFVKAFVFIGQMGKGKRTPIIEKLPSGWIDFDPNSVTYNLAKHICNF